MNYQSLEFLEEGGAYDDTAAVCQQPSQSIQSFFGFVSCSKAVKR